MHRRTRRRIDAFETDRDETFLWDSEAKGFGVRLRSSGSRAFIVK